MARAYAWALDFVLWVVFIVILSLILGSTKLGNGVLSVAMFVSFWGYPIICEVYFGGRTLGKRAAGIAVLRADGLPVGWRESSIRNILLVADFLPLFYATGLLCILFDTRFRRIGDIVAGTQVVYLDTPLKRTPPPDVAPQALPFPLTPEQQRTLTGLFERERRLPVARMHELGTLAEPLTGQTGAASLERLRGFVAGLTR